MRFIEAAAVLVVVACLAAWAAPLFPGASRAVLPRASLGMPSDHPTSGATASTVHPLVTANAFALTSTADPESVSVCWPQQSVFLFSGYEVMVSTTSFSGPWSVIADVSSAATTCFWDTAISTTGPTYWEVAVYSALTGLVSESTVLATFQPAPATLSYSYVSDSMITLSWTNNAVYGGNLSFASYKIYYGSGTLSSTVTYVGTRAIREEVQPQTAQSWYIVTTDEATRGSLSTSLTSTSNVIRFIAPGLLTAVPTVSTGSADTSQVLTFGCTATGGLYTYTFAWAFGDGSTATGATPSYAYTSAGTKVAACTVTDGVGSVATASINVVVSLLPTIATPTASLGGGVLAGKSVTFSVVTTPGPGLVTYTWLGLPSGCSSANGPDVTCSPSSAGSYAVSVSVTDANGMTVTSAPLAFTVHPVVMGLPANEGAAVIAVGSGGAVGAILAVGYILMHRRRKPAPVAAT
jgi:hypothetical protein